MRKHITTLLISLALALLMAAPGWCGQDVAMRARPGLAGIFKYSQPVLIKVDIDNRGDSIKGHLSVAPGGREMPPGRNSPVYMAEVDIPAGSKVTRELVVPGELASSNYPVVRLVAGGNTVAEAALEGTGLGGGTVIMPLGEKVTGSSLFTWLDKRYGGQVTVKYLPPEELPDKSIFLGAADVIVADREAATRLNPGQAGALKEWVMLGGTLLLSGEPAIAAGSPLSGIIQGPLGRQGALERMALGRGEVILSRTSVEEIIDPEGKVWESLGIVPGDGVLIKNEIDLKNVIANAGSYFPMVKLPDIQVLVLLWGVYLLAVGPGLYLLLRRFNRRELAWVLVPAVAALTGAGFYAMSPVNRLQDYFAHTTSAVEIMDEKLAVVRASGAFVLPRGGTLEVSGSREMLLEPVNNYSGRRDQKATAFNNGSESRVIFEGVEYASMRQVHIYGLLRGMGRVGGRVYFRDDRVAGEIVNNTPYMLRDCRLIIGKSFLELGEIPSGGSKKLDEPLNWAQIINNPSELYRFNARQSPVQMQEARIITDISVRQDNAGEVYFLGWSDSSPEQLKVIRPSGQGQAGGLTMIRQKMEFNFPPGAFRLPPGFIKYTATGLGGGLGKGPDGLVVHRGSAQISYDLAKTLNMDNFRVTVIDIPPVSDRSSSMIEIYRQDISAWEQVDRSGRRFSGDEASRYLSGQGKIELKITSQAEKAEGTFQGIAVEGVIGQ